MSQKVYECLFLLDSNRYARDPGSVSTGLNETIEKLDGEVLATRLWNEQKLAYTVNGHRKGTYWIVYFRIDGNRIPEFERACRLNDNILRNLTLAVDPRLVDVLVSHVQGNATEADVEKVAGEIADGKEDTAEKPAEEETAVAEK
ncbi:MAG: 30S ribosomal protein S6, partial [Pirellulaceae bacterium]